MLADLPWATGPACRVNQSVPTLNGPEGITLTTSEMNGVLHLEATFHASTYDPAMIARALELVCADPAGTDHGRVPLSRAARGRPPPPAARILSLVTAIRSARSDYQEAVALALVASLWLSLPLP